MSPEALISESSTPMCDMRLHFIRRLVKRTQISCSSFIVGLMYLVRLKERQQSVALPYDPLRPGCAEATVAFMMADKYLYDTPLTNAAWAESCGLPLKDVNHMEASYLSRLDFSLFFTEKDYAAFFSFLELSICMQETSRQFPITYRDMCILTQDTPASLAGLVNITLRPIQAFLLLFKMSLAGGIAYVLSVSTLYWGFRVVFMLQQAILEAFFGITSSVSPTLQLPPAVSLLCQTPYCL